MYVTVTSQFFRNQDFQNDTLPNILVFQNNVIAIMNGLNIFLINFC